MTNNTENKDIYVMADDQEAFVPAASGFLLPWWIFVLPFLLIGGLAIAYFTNANKYKTTNNPETPLVESPISNGSSPNNNVTTNPNSNNSSANNNVATNPNSNNSPINNNVATNPNSNNSSTNNNIATNPNSNNSPTNNNIATNPNSNNSPTTNNPKSLEIIETVYFAYKETEVLASDAPKLESFLSRLPDTSGTLTIAGHSDHIGPHPYNQDLAQQRAEQVANKLRELGLDKQYQVKIESWGETKPHKDNQTAQGRALNRRVVLSFTSNK